MEKKSKSKKKIVKEYYENGLTYEGEIKDGEWHGQGILISQPDGFRYEGQFKNGSPHGNGAVSIDGDHLYEGQFKNGAKDGKGILISPNGDRYEGQFKNDTLNGLGTYAWSDGRIHEGKFKDGKQHGKGTYTMPDGRYFEGEFKKGNKTNKGKYFWKDGTEYIYYGCIGREEEKKSGITITEEMLNGSEEEAPPLTNRERQELLKQIIGIESDSEEKWICNLCEREQDSSINQYLFLNHGALCPNCFDNAI